MARGTAPQKSRPVPRSLMLQGAAIALPFHVLAAGSVFLNASPALAECVPSANPVGEVCIGDDPGDPNYHLSGIDRSSANDFTLTVDDLVVDRRGIGGTDTNAIRLDGVGGGSGLLKVIVGDDVKLYTEGRFSDGVQVHAVPGGGGSNQGIWIESGADITVIATDPDADEGDMETTAGLEARVQYSGNNQDVTVKQRAGSVIDVQGYATVGIYAWTYGLGAVDVTSAGTINTNGLYGYGMFAGITNADTEKNTTVTLDPDGKITTIGQESVGIYAYNLGQGAATINVHGSIETSGEFADGALALIGNSNNDQTALINISGSGMIATSGDNAYGAYVFHSGIGKAEIVNHGEILVTGFGSFGAYALGIGGDTSVDNGGTIRATGEHGVGIVALSDATTVTLTIGTDALVEGGWQSLTPNPGRRRASGVAVASPNGSIINNLGRVLAGSDLAIIVGGGASDQVGKLTANNRGTVTGYVELADVDDNSFTNAAGGLFDIRHFADIDGDGVRDIKRVSISDFGDPDSSFDNQAGATVRLAEVLDNADTDSTDYYVPTTGTGSIPLDAGFYDLRRNGIVQGQLVNLGTFSHAGVIDLRGPEIGNTLVITANPQAGGDPGSGVFISNGGTLLLNTVLNAGVVPGGGSGSQSDVLVVDGTQLGTAPTTIVIDRRERSGALTTDNGILLVEVRNKEASAPGVFTLQGDYVDNGEQRIIAGVYSYGLYHNGVDENAADGNWYLRNVALAPTVPVYQEYPKVLVPLVELPTLKQRAGNRHSRDPAPAAPAETVFCKDASQNFRCTVTPEQASYYISEDGAVTIETGAVWGRIEGAHGHYEAAVSTIDAEYDATTWHVQAGFDGLLAENDSGKLIGGISARYGHIRSDITSTAGGGSIKANGYGIGGSLTWYGYNGFYVDAQGQATWLKSDIRSANTNMDLADGNKGFGYALGLEAGYRHALNDRWSLTPQAQLVYSRIDFDRFVDPLETSVVLRDGDSLRGRVGLAAEYESRWKAENGTTSRANVYGIANLYHEFLDGYRVSVAGTEFTSRNDRSWGGIGLGATLNWDDDKYSVFGEASVSTSLNSFGDGHRVAGTVGLRVKW